MIAVSSLAIGIAATTAVFSICNALLVRPIPGIAAASRLVDVGRTDEGRGFDTTSNPNYRDLRERTRALEGVYAYGIEPGVISLGTEHGGEPLHGSVVSGNYFNVLGVAPAAGRLLADSDDRAGAEPVVVLGYDVWKNRFHSDPAIVGRTLIFNSHPNTVIGVAPAGFQGTSILTNDVWFPLANLEQAIPRLHSKMLNSRQSLWLMMGGRLKPGISLADANAELKVLGASLERDHPEANRHRSYVATPLSRFPGRTGTIAAFVAVLMLIVGLILMIVCVNVAGMLLARGAERQYEFATRIALGADRLRLVRQLMTEAGVLFFVSALFGIVLSNGIIVGLERLLPKLPVSISLDLGIDWRVIVFALGVAFVSTIASGLAPALTTTRLGLVSYLRLTPLTGSWRSRPRDIFLFVQISLSVLLLVVAGLFARAVQRAAAVNPGFSQERVDVVSVDLALGGYDEHTGPAFARELVQRVQSVPSVEAASATVDLPLDGNIFGYGPITAPGTSYANAENSLNADANLVEPGYFETMKLPLTAGRDFTVGDNASAPKVAIVNNAFANRLWPGLNPIGREFQMADDPKKPVRLTVVGVAADARLVSLTDPVKPYYYMPLGQSYISRISLVVRHRGETSSIPEIRKAVVDMNSNLPITSAMTMKDVTAIEEVPQRIAAALAGSLGSFGLLLVGMGIYATVAHAVVRRTREIGLRIALGAGRKSIVALVARRTALIAASACATALLLGVALNRVLSSVMRGLVGADPAAYGIAVVALALATIGATLLPARRAIAMDPAAALRVE